MHVPDKGLVNALGEAVLEASVKYFRADFSWKTFEQMEDELRQQGVSRYALLPVPNTRTNPDEDNKLTAERAQSSSSAIGFAWVDPLRDPLGTIKRALKLGLVNLKLHPTLQGVYPDHEALVKVYQELSEVKGTVIIHTGTSGIGGGIKGGGGLRIGFSKPIPVDNVAAQFPDVNFVMAHFGWPWYNEAIAVALQKANVYLDLSGWDPKYIPQEVWTYARTLLKTKILYGSDYPFVKPSRWVSSFEKIDLPQEVRQLITYGNAEALFS
ncbi:MAG: amidohydrolase family protein [Thermoprotei archaeon]